MNQESPEVRVRNLSKSYQQGSGQNTVLKDLDLRVHSGEIVTVMGKSGSGKSTLLNLISGIERADAGTIRIGDREMTGLSEEQRTLFRRRSIGMVFQFFNLIPTFTVRENVLFPLQLNQRAEDGLVDRFLRRLDLTSNRDQFPSTLSGGERQRVAIARALVHQPSLILADEPTGNLDYRLSETVLEEFLRCCREQQVAVLMATHASECARISDRILELRDGRLHPGGA